MRAFHNALLAQQLSRLVYQISVPGRPQGCATGQACSGDAGKELCASNTIGTVGSANRGDVVFGYRMCVPEVNSCFVLTDAVSQITVCLTG